MWLLENVKLHTWLIFMTSFIVLFHCAGPHSPAFPLPHPDSIGQVI